VNMDAAELKRTAQQYHRAAEVAEQIVADALCDTFRQITGKAPSDRMREAIFDAVRFNC